MALQPPDQFLRSAADLRIEFEPGDLNKLGLFLALLLEANTRFNLTAIKDPQEAWTRHILDSLTLVPYIVSWSQQEEQESGAAIRPVRVIDIGSGGGLPGIPLAIVMPQIQFTLLEATGKKARFLQETADALQLRNISVVNERAELAGQDHHEHREQYDIAIARAVGKLSVLLEITVPFVKVGGHMLAMKGQKAPEEIAEAKQALHMLHAQVIDTTTTPTGVIVTIEKTRKTPRVYPRSPGEPKRAPLR
jgi:16S rRNA (guanine527-N7)-methyltransferase